MSRVGLARAGSRRRRRRVGAVVVLWASVALLAGGCKMYLSDEPPNDPGSGESAEPELFERYLFSGAGLENLSLTIYQPGTSRLVLPAAATYRLTYYPDNDIDLDAGTVENTADGGWVFTSTEGKGGFTLQGTGTVFLVTQGSIPGVSGAVSYLYRESAATTSAAITLRIDGLEDEAEAVRTETVTFNASVVQTTGAAITSGSAITGNLEWLLRGNQSASTVFTPTSGGGASASLYAPRDELADTLTILAVAADDRRVSKTMTVRLSGAKGITIDVSGGLSPLAAALADLEAADFQAAGTEDDPLYLRLTGLSAESFAKGEGVAEVLKAPEGGYYIRLNIGGDSLLSLPAYSFAGCGRLLSVSLPDGFDTIGERAFAGCAALSRVTLPSSLSVIEESAFAGCAALESLTLPAKLSAIGNHAFTDSGLQDVTLPENVNKLEAHAFTRCPALTSVTFARSSRLTTIAESAFAGCAQLESVTLPAASTVLQTIEKTAFYGTALTTIAIPKSITTIGAAAFPATVTSVQFNKAGVTFEHSGTQDSFPDAAALHTAYTDPLTGGAARYTYDDDSGEWLSSNTPTTSPSAIRANR